MKVGLTFACMNLKKLARMKQRHGLLRPLKNSFLSIFAFPFVINEKPGLELSY